MYPIQSKHRKKSTIFAAKVPEIKNVQGGGLLGGEANSAINTGDVIPFPAVLFALLILA